ncbi:LacI family DNA-binding transcriptional regulator [Nitratireductor sp. ZSWI3]|uniref:LacI family DNA-binding transcriptional regulator n=1 Tax=Nitratireductor sp. ZSWI3 TaxID=2966359 RepID=UPI00214FC03B|nr:LacI family DNA-binding transcriptional regulator [Nitratireductor sp. ZSWI3]MCR4267204.1 LacI family transcriptional regulator [Nitratireductor sp. ZSWI3]
MRRENPSQRRSASAVSIRDVAQRAGVSPGSVSNVLNGKRRRDDPIGRAVLEAVKALDYRPNAIASSLRRAESRVIGLVIPDFQNPFFAELVAELERCAEETGYRIVATSSRESADVESREIRELLGWRVAGLFLAPTAGSTYGREHLADQDVPSVIVDRVFEKDLIDGVGVDNAEATEAVMRELIELGHRRILVAYFDDAVSNVAERLDGVRRAAMRRDGPLHVDYLACGPTVESALAAFEKHFDANPVPTAIFCLFNTATLAAYSITRKRGLEAGRDVALVGFDDSAWLAHMTPPIAAIVQPVQVIARRAWSMLMGRIGGGLGPARTERVSCRFERRGTMTPPRNGGMEAGRRK